MLALDDKVSDLLAEEGRDEAMCTKIEEVFAGHGLPMDMTLRTAVQQPCLIVRPRYVLYINDRTNHG